MLEGKVIYLSVAELKKFIKIAPSMGVALLSMPTGKIISLTGHKFDFNEISSEFLTQFLNNKEKQIVASKLLKNNKDTKLITLGVISEVENIFLLVQTNEKDIRAFLTSGLKESLSVMASIFIFILITALIISNRIARPLDLLILATQKISQGHWIVDLPSSRKDEIGLLVNSFRNMGLNLKQREDEIKRVNKKLAQKERLASLGLLSAGIAHEVKNPLGAILANAQLIQRKIKGEDNPDAVKYSKTIVDETYRANQIVQDLLAFSKQKELVLANIDTKDFITYLENVMKEKFQVASIELVFSHEIDSFTADREQLIQVIQNIAFNALDALVEQKSSNGVVEIQFKRRKDDLIISIKDNGPGLDPSIEDRIFEPFVSTKGSKGTGLGMAITYGIVQQHHGDIQIETSPDQGTTFTIKIPCAS